MKMMNYTGKGIGVAILDTGISPHPDFGNRICAFSDFISHKQTPYDDNGHGTHVTGILCGDGTASGGNKGSGSWMRDHRAEGSGPVWERKQRRCIVRL